MSKLYKFKEWVTVQEAAKRIALVCDEDVTQADMLRLALDGHIPASIYFPDVQFGKRTIIKPVEISTIFPQLTNSQIRICCVA